MTPTLTERYALWRKGNRPVPQAAELCYEPAAVSTGGEVGRPIGATLSCCRVGIVELIAFNVAGNKRGRIDENHESSSYR